MTATGRSVTQSEIDRSAVLRRVAIVLNSLPRATAEKLLGTFDQGSVASLKRAMQTLVDVDPMEQKRAIEAFRFSLRSQPSGTSHPGRDGNRLGSEGAVFEGSSDRYAVGAGGGYEGVGHPLGTPHAGPAPMKDSPILKDIGSEAEAISGGSVSNTSALSFLGNVPERDLGELLAAEHPQAIALVLASIQPGIAAKVLPRLPEPLRSQAVNRIGRLNEIPQDAASELAGHFQAKLRERKIQQTSAAGRQTLAAIMAEMPQAESSQFQEPDKTQSNRVAPLPYSAPDRGGSSSDLSHPSPSSGLAETSESLRKSEAETIAESLSSRLRVVGEVESDSTASARMGAEDATSSPLEMGRYAANADEIHSFDPPSSSERAFEGGMGAKSTDEIHQHLQSLTPLVLCQALGRVETRDAMLALCGLPSEIAEAALNVLPQEHANSVRLQMANLSRISLREIDHAKEKVAHAAQSSNAEQQPESVPMAA